MASGRGCESKLLSQEAFHLQGQEPLLFPPGPARNGCRQERQLALFSFLGLGEEQRPAMDLPEGLLRMVPGGTARPCVLCGQAGALVLSAPEITSTQHSGREAGSDVVESVGK